jgi:hypothetical protein
MKRRRQDVVMANIRGILATRGLTHTAFADQLHWHKQTLSKRMVGDTALTLDDLDHIATTLKVDIADLVTEATR